MKKSGKEGFTVVELGCVLLLVVVGVMICFARTSRHQKDIPSAATTSVTIDNPLLERPVIHSAPQQPQQKIGWAVASNTSSGVLIEASVKVKY